MIVTIITTRGVIATMGVCYSKSSLGDFDTNTEGSELSTSNSKVLIYESPRWSAETGDKGKLGSLFYKRRQRRIVGTSDMFSARLESLLGGIQSFQMRRSHSHSHTHSHSPGEVTFASFVGTPFIRNLEIQGMDALARSYAASAAKAAARESFLLLQERDKSETVEVLSPMIKIQTPDRTRLGEEMILPDEEEEEEDEDDDDEEEFELGIRLDSPDEEIDVLEEEEDELSSSTSPNDQDDEFGSSELSDFTEQDIDLYKAGMHRAEQQKSFFDSCFPATGRWASVVNAARQSACLPRPQNSERIVTLQPRIEIVEVIEQPGTSDVEFEIRRETPQEMMERMQAACHNATEDARWSSDSIGDGHACVGCCGISHETSVSAGSKCRSVRSETGSSSDHQIQNHNQNQNPNLTDRGLAQRDLPSRPNPNPPSYEDAKDCASPLGKGLRIDIRNHNQNHNNHNQIVEDGRKGSIGRATSSCCASSMCSTSEEKHRQHQHKGSSSEHSEHGDPDVDAFFSFPSSPSAKALEEMGSGHIIEEMKSAKLLEELGMHHHHHHHPYDPDEEDLLGEEGLQGPRGRAESPRGGHSALSKGAFGSPFPVLGSSSGRKTRPILVDKKLKFFSLERVSTAILARKVVVNSDGAVVGGGGGGGSSSSDSYLDTSTSSSNPSRRRDPSHDWEDYSSDLFEIENMQPMKGFSGLELSCLPIKKTFGCTGTDVSECCSSEVNSAPPCGPSESSLSNIFLQKCSG